MVEKWTIVLILTILGSFTQPNTLQVLYWQLNIFCFVLGNKIINQMQGLSWEYTGPRSSQIIWIEHYSVLINKTEANITKLI